MYLFTIFPNAYRGNAYQERKDNRNCIRFAFFMLTFFIFIAFTFEASFSPSIKTQNLFQYTNINRESLSGFAY